MLFIPKENHPNKSWLIDIISLTTILIVVYTVFLGHYPLFTPDEGRYAEIALNMAITNDYITPHMNGVIFLDKPILHFWLQAIAIKLFGVKEWAIRLPPALFGIMGVLLIYICGRHLFDRRCALISASILATTPLYFGGAHYANLDLEVAVLISCALLPFISAVQKKDHRLYFLLISYMSAALAFLAKGLIGIIFPMMIIGTWLAFSWRWLELKKIHLLLGFSVIICIITPWYILVQQANPQFLYYFFIEQQITRYLSGAIFNNQMPFWFFLPVILVGFLPWTIFIIPALAGKSIFYHSTKLFLILWIMIIFIFFSIPHSKLVGYILPIFPPLALLVGNYLSETWNNTKRLLFKICIFSSVIFLLILTFNAELLNQKSAKPLALQLKQLIKPQDEVITYFRYFQDIPFYLEQHVSIVADWDSPDIIRNDNWLREFWNSLSFQENRERFISDNMFWQRWQSKKRIFVFVSTNRLDQFQAQAKNYHLIGKHNNISLISNKQVM
ncbi:MAG TPA: glycosyltransferase family 39 protein [Gammaproteobacteria bacterium]|nr:glycosyltransferase family 39 protein [Gammaproteobacteria bacterium]